MVVLRRRITQLVFYGILVFLVGFFFGKYWLEYFQWLIPFGSLMTFLGIYLFFAKTDLKGEFQFGSSDDVLTYFWNVLFLKFQTFIFAIWMIIMMVELLSKGSIR